jgi:Uma2 family endonuclease
MVIEHRLYTVEEFEELADSPENRERLLELINGEIVEKVPTQEHGVVAGNIYGPLWNDVKQRKSGRVVMEVRHRASEDKRNARIPDISYTAGNEPLVKKGSVPRMPDLAVEIKSPDDSLKELREKARYYLAHGTRLVWLVIPEKRFIEVYTADEEYILDESETLTGGDILPGFTLPVRDVFADPVADE